MPGTAPTVLSRLRSFHPLQRFHLANGILGLVTACLLISTATHIESFISQGSALAGYGNYITFAYPATYVYMFIPTISSCVYSFILMCDASPAYTGWKPSKTFISSIGLTFGSLLMAALFPMLPGADIIVAPDAALSCTWTNYMQWRTMFNDPVAFPWVTDVDVACDCLRAADFFCWTLAVGWAIVFGLCIQGARRHVPATVSEKPIATTSMPIASLRDSGSNKYFIDDHTTY